MARYFMTLAYRGAPFHGWQTQPGAVTVQQTIEEGLSTILRRPMKIVGAGRTDTGVNASKMVAHFDLESPLPMPEPALVRALNSVLGKNIAIRSIEEVHPELHARFSATSRTYRYYVVTRKSPFAYPLSWQAPPGLDFEAMNRAAAILLSTADFTSFAKLHSDAVTNICRVTHAEWVRLSDDAWMFVITADRFLRNMVRAVVGTLVDVGRGKLTTEGFGEIIARRDRCAAGTSMPPQALFLHDVTYSPVTPPYHNA